MEETKDLIKNQQKKQNKSILCMQMHKSLDIKKKYQLIYSITDLQPIITGNLNTGNFNRNSYVSMTLIQTPANNPARVSYLEQFDQGIKAISKVIAWTNDNDDVQIQSFGVNEESEYCSESSEAFCGGLKYLQQRINLDLMGIQQQKLIEPLRYRGAFNKNQQKRLKNLEEHSNQTKKGCNCKKTQCLKLYCDCFRQNKKCQGCNCTGCHNTQQFNQQRNNAMAILIDRDPQAFKPKIQSQSHTKGCNCKKSGCQKKYCECFQAGLKCGEMCKCTQCKNCKGNDKRKRIKKIKVNLPFDFKIKSKNGPTIIVPIPKSSNNSNTKLNNQ